MDDRPKMEDDKLVFASGREAPLREFMGGVRNVMDSLVEESDTKNRQRADKLDSRLKKLEEVQGTLVSAVTGAMTSQSQAGTSGTNGRGVYAKADIQPFVNGFFANVWRRPVKDGECDMSSYNDYQAAWPQWLRRGDAVPADISAAMRVGSDPDGGYWVPGEFSHQIHQRLFDTSDVRAVATVERMNSDHRDLPIDSGDLVSGGWVGETQARPETENPKVGLQSIYAREQYAQPKVTQKMLDDVDLNLEEWLLGKIASKFARDENLSFIAGLGIVDPTGMLSYKIATAADDVRAWGTLQYFPSGAAGGFPYQSGSTIGHDADALIDLSMSLKAEYAKRARWAMKRTTAALVRKLKDREGRYMWTDSIAEGKPPMLLGFPVQLWENLPSVAANSLAIMFGDFSGYHIYDHRVGVRILRDHLTEKGFVKYYATKRCGGSIVAEGFDSIKLMKFSAS